MSTLAGLAGTSGSTEGTGSTARFNRPSGLAVDGSGNIYVADRDNHTLRKVTAAGVVSTLAGLASTPGFADGAGSLARFNHPSGVAVDGSGTLYVADTDNHTLRKVTAAGVVSTLAGLAGSFGSADGAGSAARFYSPYSAAVDGSSNVYVADGFNHTVRKVTAAAVVSTVAGLAGSFGAVPGPLPATLSFGFEAGIGLTPAGDLIVPSASGLVQITAF